MPVKIRLQRKGRKARPFYHIVIADGRAPRDGKYIERVGSYNPVTNPATIELNFERALNWLQDGAVPTDTCKSILSEKGVMMMHHLLNGAKKGAFSEEEAEKRFNSWLSEKEAKVQAKKDKLTKASEDDATKRFEAEVKVNEDRAQAIAKRLTDAREAVAKANAEEAAEQAPEQAASEEAPAEEAPKTEE